MSKSKLICKHCDTRLPAQARFCTNCGTPTGIASQEANYADAKINQLRPNGNLKIYKLEPVRYKEILEKLKGWLSSQDLEVQTIPVDDDTTFIQVRSKGRWRRLIGMTTALSIHLDMASDNLKVTIGEGKWMGKIATGSISMFVLWPLAVTTAVGVYTQMKYPEKVFDFIEAII